MANGKGQSNAVTTNRYASVITFERRENAIAARGQTARQVQPAGGYFTGSSEELEASRQVPAIGIKLDASLLSRRLNGTEIEALGKIGGQRLSAMPYRAEVRMLNAEHSLAGGKEGVYAIYHTDGAGKPCVTPLLLDAKGWAALWSEAVSWDSHLEQPFPYLPGDFRQIGGQPVGNGHTFVLDLTGTDRSGAAFAEGPHRFFIANREYQALAATMQIGSIAHKTLQAATRGKMPSNTRELYVLAIQVAQATAPKDLMGNPRELPFSVVAGYLQLGAWSSETSAEEQTQVRNDFLNPSNFKDAVARLAEVREMNARNAEEAKQRQAGTFGSTAAAEAMEEGSLVTDEMPTI